MSHELVIDSANDYKAGIDTLRTQVSKGGKTITESKEHQEAVIVVLKVYGQPALNVLLQKSSLYVLGFQGFSGKTWFVFQGYSAFANTNTGSIVKVEDKVRKTMKETYKPGDSKDIGVGCNYNGLGVFGSGQKASGGDIIEAIQGLAGFKIGETFNNLYAAALFFIVSESLRFSEVTTAVVNAIAYEADLEFDQFKDKVTSWDKTPQTDVVIKKG